MRARAFVLINLAAGASRDVLARLKKMEFVAEVHAVSGPYDMVAIVNGATFNEIGVSVVEKIQPIPGIIKTITCNVIFLEN
ncbi:MAG TPA: Lrp/AsnC family transcriptional regulator [Candidatus Eisenbacteria bacterium]|uniref:Lrp/AsnC family transcriptional regulator n=1 Tax=Eiseniibacteriota bacterium TaxID=2212470 RepID=A0A7V2F3W1_UNCEI|nr:Lrp/AsnC family transcriptional regulator [Candidatus Eisenbacteria bacterium]